MLGAIKWCVNFEFFFDDKLSRFDTISDCYRWTDGRTDGVDRQRSIANTLLCVALVKMSLAFFRLWFNTCRHTKTEDKICDNAKKENVRSE